MKSRACRNRPRWRGVLGRHWLGCALLALGLALRVLAVIGYRPALLYTDSLKYLYGAWPGADPLGYAAILKAILPFGGIATVVAIQHLLGLAMAVAIYVVLLRRGVSRCLAALAIAPVLLDAYQVQMEQTVMPDVWFEALVVAALGTLLWRGTASGRAAVAAGLLIGASACVREVGLALIVPAMIWLIMAEPRRWVDGVAKAFELFLACLGAVVLYCVGSLAVTGQFSLSNAGGLAGRMAASADCATLRIPADVRALCPTPAEQANGENWLTHSSHSPLKSVPVPRGVSRGGLISALDHAVETQQPGRVIGAILRDSVPEFALARTPLRGVTPLSRWQFQAGYPSYPPWIRISRSGVIELEIANGSHLTRRTLGPADGGPARVDRPVAAFLRSYQLGGGYTPGPLLAVFALAGLAGSALAVLAVLAGSAPALRRRRPALRRRRPGLAVSMEHRMRFSAVDAPSTWACLLFTACGVAVLLISDVFEFSWRYQLPALVTLPPAGVLGVTALLRFAGQRRLVRSGPPAAGPGPADLSPAGQAAPAGARQPDRVGRR